jgi:peptidoglycan hydrolase-like protein with peptidoglycan-binding domain
MPAIDKVLFATFCLRQANFCGVSAHYLVAVAQLRSQISDDAVVDRIGPFRFTQGEWNLNRKNPEFEPDFEPEDVTSWRMQCSVFARMVNGVLEALRTQSAGQLPSALDLYLAQLAAGGTPVTDAAKKNQLEADLGAALQETKAIIVRVAAEVLDSTGMPAAPETTPNTVLFRRTPGLAPVTGHLIANLQEALIQRGHLPSVDAAGRPNKDGIFGPATESALEAWQTATGHPSTGAITNGQWPELTGLPPPDIYQRCAQVTAAFEGTGFGGTNDTNFDNTVLTFGYHGYTITGGNLQAFLQKVDTKHPALLNQTFGNAMAAQLRTLFPPVSTAQATALGRALFLSGNTVKQEWREAFMTFGESSECQAEQLAFSREVYWSLAEKMRDILKLSEPLSHAVCFDVAVQNGDKRALATATAGAFTSTMGEADRRIRFGEEIASASLPAFQDDVRKRKVLTLGQGSGTVHGDQYRLANWGFAAAESAEPDDAPVAVLVPSGSADFHAFFNAKFPGLTAFTANEFLVKGGAHASNHLNTDPPEVLWPNIVKTVQVLVELKKRLGNAAVTLNSVYRSRAYNESVGGARDSQHMKFTAADIVVHDGRAPSDWARALHGMRNAAFFSGGIGLYGSFVHVDTRGYNADWG